MSARFQAARRILRRGSQLVGAVLLSVALVACSSTGDKPKPTPLASVKPRIAGKQVWRAGLDEVGFPLAIASVRDGFVLADSKGQVLALTASDGVTRWKAEVGARLSAGVGSDGRHAAVVSVDNELIVLDGEQRGQVVWRTRLASRVTTAPLVAGERVFVVGVDRVALAFDVKDGRKLWTLQRPGDALTLSQSGVLAPYQNTLLVGQGARLAGIDPTRGELRWETAIATPRGTNEVERLADLVGPLARQGNTLCARSFQAAVGCVDAERGGLLWSRNASGRHGLAIGEGLLYGTDGNDRISAWKLANGDSAWSTDAYLHRGLTAPATIGRTLVFGDVEGQVLFLSGDDGDLLLNLPTDGSPIVAAPALSGTTLVVATRKGGIYAFRPE